MEQIEQLKAMRDAARARIEAMPDHRLMTSLSALIEDLESAFGGKHSPAGAAPQADRGEPSRPQAQPEPEADAIDAAETQQAEGAAEEQMPQDAPDVIEETVVVVETAPEAQDDDSDLLIAPEEIENLIAAEVVSMNGEANGASEMAETEEEAVNRALDELSIDLADTLGGQPEGFTRR
jgi:hypothetical protein